jgi:DNA-binding NarL/FixJ family response regulator
VRVVAQGECVVDPELVRQLLHQVTQQHAGRVTALAGPLTALEQHILRLITDGRTNRTIAQMLGYPVGTVKAFLTKPFPMTESTAQVKRFLKPAG